jgi:hypothetical protein
LQLATPLTETITRAVAPALTRAGAFTTVAASGTFRVLRV